MTIVIGKIAHGDNKYQMSKLLMEIQFLTAAAEMSQVTVESTLPITKTRQHLIPPITLLYVSIIVEYFLVMKLKLSNHFLDLLEFVFA